MIKVEHKAPVMCGQENVWTDKHTDKVKWPKMKLSSASNGVRISELFFTKLVRILSRFLTKVRIKKAFSGTL